MILSRYAKMAIINHGKSPRTEKIRNRRVRRLCSAANGGFWVLTHPDYFFHREKYFPSFELLLSRGCPFNCKTCIHFLPDYGKEVSNEPAADVIEEMKTLLNAVSRIDELFISGGDAFLYPELATVLKYLKASPKIGKITVVSSGNVSPSGDVIDLLPNSNIRIKVENYGQYSEKKEEFLSLNSPNIYLTEYYDEWDDFGDEKCRNRNDGELALQYSACKKERYCMLNGKIYACPRSAHGENLGFFKENADAVIDVKITKDKKELLRRIADLRKLKFPTACNYCNSQTKAFNTYKIEERYKD